MKAPPLVVTGSLVTFLLALLAITAQRGAAHDLRQEMAGYTATLAEPPPAAPAADDAASTALTEAERLELLRLRGQLGRLRADARGLATAEQEHTNLQQRLTAVRANPGNLQNILPPGYILRRNARNAGQATPQATVETLLWAAEHRDLKTLLETLSPEEAQKMAEQVQRQGDKFWEGAAQLPGMWVREQRSLPDGTVELKLAVDPRGEGETQTMKSRLVDGRWRLDLR